MTSATASLVAGATSLACMAVACILSSRWSFIEDLLGGLDRMYETHKWLGIWALVFVVYHFLFKAKLNTWDLAPILELTKYWTRMVRQLSIVVLGFIILLALNRNVPYQVWSWWHKLSGPFFIIAVLHWLSFESPIRLNSSAGIWLGTLCTVGIVAAFYKLFLYNFIAQGGTYKIVAVDHGDKAVHLELAPIGRSFPFQAGQFGFLSIMEQGLREPHPFTIASANASDGRIHFVIRALGDYTEKLYGQAKIGMLADIRAPHGRFERIANANKEIWIGAGVGIAPFISWLKDSSAKNLERVQLIYCFDPNRAFPTPERIQEFTEQANVSFIPNPSGSNKLAETITGAAKEADPSDIHISFCGPKGLLAHVKQLMKEADIPSKNIHYEFFEFR
ncbi:ferredoxin reductase family protein [Paracandidimonas soli]|nr:ferredoxin reductase family protein [Paracandidimonas soli]